MANTNILIKRSNTTSAPGSLLAGELAYSYQSNTAYIGTSDGAGVVKIGGQAYTSQIDAATDLATGDTLVKRDATGNASFNYVFANIVGEIIGNANSATQLQTARDFSISGGDITAASVSFDGTGNVTLDASLNAIPGLSANTYGSTTAIPVLDIAANGRITGVTTAAISTSFNLYGDSGVTVVSGGDSLTLTGGNGITSVAGVGPNVTFDVDNTVVRANTPITLQTIDSSVEISGNLTVLGTQFVTNTTTLNIADPLIYLAANNYYGDAVDIGFAGNYFDGVDERHMGVFRNAGNKEFYVFDNYLPEISGNNEIDVADASFRTANLNTGWIKSAGIISDGINLNTYLQDAYNLANTNASDITIIQGVNDGQNTYIGAVESYAQSSYAQANTNADAIAIIQGVDLAQNTYISNVETYAQSAYSRANASVVATSTLTSGQMVVGNGSNNVTVVANTTYTQTGTLASNNTITSVTVDEYGRFAAATVSAISGLTVGQGGTGLSSITAYGITYGNGTDPVGVTAAAGAADQTWSNQILTVTNAGVPVWTTALDGGVF